MDEAVHESDGAGGMREDLTPLRKGLVRGDQNGPSEVVATSHDLEEEVRVASAVGQVADLINAQQPGQSPTAHAASESAGAILGREIGEHVAGAGESDGVAAYQSMVGDILEDHGLADAIGTDEDGVGAIVETGQSEELLNSRSVDLSGRGPIETVHGLEGADLGVANAAVQASALSLGFLDVEELRDPGLLGDLRPTGK